MSMPNPVWEKTLTNTVLELWFEDTQGDEQEEESVYGRWRHSKSETSANHSGEHLG